MSFYDYYSLEIIAYDIQNDLDSDHITAPLDIREHMEHLVKELKRLSKAIYDVGKYMDGDHSAETLRELIQGSGE